MERGRPLIFGEVLFDCFPDGREVLGGAPFNVAWNLQAFGQEPLFISRVGADEQGRHIRDTMSAWSMDTSGLQQDDTRPTGRVEISLDGGEPTFEILADQAYDHISADLPRIGAPPVFLYHGSLALRSETSRDALTKLREANPSPVFLDVNLRRPWWNSDSVLAMIEDATWLKLNEVELTTLFPDAERPDECCSMLLDRYSLEAVFLTMGSKGAMAFSRDSGSRSVKPSASVQVSDTVGAGDAFSSILLLGLMQEWPLQDTLDRAQKFASAVVGLRGATTEERAFYKTFSDRWLKL